MCLWFGLFLFFQRRFILNFFFLSYLREYVLIHGRILILNVSVKWCGKTKKNRIIVILGEREVLEEKKEFTFDRLRQVTNFSLAT
jgi:hypothetical protein